MDHWRYHLLVLVTHAVIGYALVQVLTRHPPVAGVLGGVVADVDRLFDPDWTFPIVHRGITHTPLLGALLVGGLLTFTRSRVVWFYPVSAVPRCRRGHPRDRGHRPPLVAGARARRVGCGCPNDGCRPEVDVLPG